MEFDFGLNKKIMTIKEKLFQKKNLWHLGAVLLFLLVAVIYFFPALKGYTVNQGDVRNWAGMAQEIIDYRESGENVNWTNSMFSGMPGGQISANYEGKQVMNIIKDVLTLWLPQPISLIFLYFVGFYLLSQVLRMKPLIGMLGAVAYGFSSYFIIIVEAGHSTKGFALAFAPFVLAAFLFAYQRKNWILGIGLSALFMALELGANHLQITYYLAFVMVFMGLAEMFKAIKQNKAGHFLKVTGGLLVAYLIAVGVNIGNIWGTLEYTKYTTRGGTELTINADGSSKEYSGAEKSGLDKDYITQWSYGPDETFSLIVPNYKGGESQLMGNNESNEDYLKKVNGQFKSYVAQSNQYWGDQPFTSGPVYVGITIVFLAILGIVYSEEKWKWALVSVTLLTIFLSWGKNYVSWLVILPSILYLLNIFLPQKQKLVFNIANTLLLFVILGSGGFGTASLTDFFLNNVPGYNKFRAVSMILVVAELCLPILAMLFLHQLWKKKDEIKQNAVPFYITSGVFFLILLGFFIAPDTFNSFLSQGELAQMNSITDPNQSQMYNQLFGDIEQVRMSIFKADVGRSLFFLIVSIGTILLFLFTTASKYLWVALLTFFVFFDLLLVDLRYLNNEKNRNDYKQWTELYKRKFPYSAGEAEKQILAMEIAANPELKSKIDSAQSAALSQAKELGYEGVAISRYVDWATYRTLNRNTNFRVFDFNNPFNSSYASYFNKSIGGYHGAKLGRYQELIEFHIGNGNKAVLDMLNVKYQIQHQDDPYGGTVSQLINVNGGALGNAWLVKNVDFVANSDEEILSMNSDETFAITPTKIVPIIVNGKSISEKTEVTAGDDIKMKPMWVPDTMAVQIPFQALKQFDLTLIADSSGINWAYSNQVDSTILQIVSAEYVGNSGWDPASTALVDQRFKDQISKESYSGEGSIELTNYHPDKLEYKFNSNEEQLVVFSEVYYPLGWKAFIDGKEEDIARVNYILRAIEVPAGEHIIEFKYELDSQKNAGIIAWLASIIILLLVGFGFYMNGKISNNEEEAIDSVE